MDFLSKCKVLGELWLFYREEANANEQWRNFFNYNDIALPASYLISSKYVTENEDSELMSFIDESWEMFCEYIDINPDANYESIVDAWGASSQPVLDNENNSQPQE
jgi:hypothetical protein